MNGYVGTAPEEIKNFEKKNAETRMKVYPFNEN